MATLVVTCFGLELFALGFSLASMSIEGMRSYATPPTCARHELRDPVRGSQLKTAVHKTAAKR